MRTSGIHANVKGKIKVLFSDDRYRRILYTGSSTFLLRFITIAIGFITVPLTLKYLGDERYGLWMSISSILALMSFADLGLGNSLLNSIAKANGRHSIEDAQVAISSTFYLLLTISILLSIALFVAYPTLNIYNFFNVQSLIAKQEAGPTVLVLLLCLLINMPLGIIQRIYEGYQDGFTYQLWLLAGTLLGFVILMIGIWNKSGLPFLVFSYSCGNILASLLGGAYMFIGKKKNLIPRWQYFNFSEGKNALRTGFIFLILQLFSFLNLSIDNIIISHTLGPVSIPPFEIVRKLFSVSLILVFFITPLWPAFAEAMEKKDFRWAQNTLQKMLRYSVILGALGTLPLVIFGKQLILLWVGAEYVPTFYLLLGFYFFSIIAVFGGVMSTFFSSSIFLKRQLLLVSTATISTVICKIIFIKYFGIDGLMWANVICFSVFFIIPSLRLTNKFFLEQQFLRIE